MSKNAVANSMVCGNQETEFMYADKCSVGQALLGCQNHREIAVVALILALAMTQIHAIGKVLVNQIYGQI